MCLVPSPELVPTCELWAQSLWIVNDVLPQLLKLGYPSNVLQEPHQIPANHEAIHELWGGEKRDRESLLGKRHGGVSWGLTVRAKKAKQSQDDSSESVPGTEKALPSLRRALKITASKEVE